MAEETPLHENLKFDFFRQALAGFLQGLWLAGDNFGGPPRPFDLVVLVLERHEEDVIVEPEPVLVTKGRQLRLLLGRRQAAEAVERAVQLGQLPGSDPLILAPAGTKFGGVLKIGRCQPAAIRELAKIDEQRVSGKGRETLVRRIAVASRPQRQHLPDSLPRSHQGLDEFKRLGPQVADAVRAGERRDMQQNSRTAQRNHEVLLGLATITGQIRRLGIETAVATRAATVRHSRSARR